MKKFLPYVLIALCCSFFVGCATRQMGVSAKDNLTVGKVQREIKIGMSSAGVIEALGSPNMVTTDDQRRETWVYDKVSTNIDASSSSRGVWFLIAAAGASKQSSSTSQRTLTIIIKFDEAGKVRDFAYRTSSF